jgi:[acyl-carrier-protein] S-malonyltransferase
VLQAPQYPVVTNCDAQLTSDAGAIKDKLVRQVSSPVLWEASVRAMIAQGADTFIEVGPGRVLSGLLRRIDKKMKSLNVEDPDSLQKTLAGLA